MGGKPTPKNRAASAAGAASRPAPARVAKILEVLDQTWGHATCELDHDNAYQLLVATILSAQSTDRGVNKVTPALFSRYPTSADLADADPDELEALIRPTGFYRMKARHLLGMARAVAGEHGGEVPRDLPALVALPGVARKTANVVLGTAYGIASGIVVDTHVQRVSRRLHLTAEDKPERIERDLVRVVPRDRWITFSHQLIWHGRRICHARTPACRECPLAPLCPEAQL
jgi:endonuclease III